MSPESGVGSWEWEVWSRESWRSPFARSNGEVLSCPTLNAASVPCATHGLCRRFGKLELETADDSRQAVTTNINSVPLTLELFGVDLERGHSAD